VKFEYRILYEGERKDQKFKSLGGFLLFQVPHYYSSFTSSDQAK
jgi:hypothetical protein